MTQGQTRSDTVTLLLNDPGYYEVIAFSFSTPTEADRQKRHSIMVDTLSSAHAFVHLDSISGELEFEYDQKKRLKSTFLSNGAFGRVLLRRPK